MDYNRELLVTILVHHRPNQNSHCRCGETKLGESWPEHIADVYERLRGGQPVQSVPDIKVRPDIVNFRGTTEELWNATACTCGQGDEAGHYLGCEKWQVVWRNASTEARR